jgi:pyrimidine deaminase RibD-like protein
MRASKGVGMACRPHDPGDCMHPSAPVLHRCPNSEIPRAADRHDMNPALPRHCMYRLVPEQMPECVECGARHMFTLYGALAFARDWTALEKMPPAVQASLLESIVRLEWYAIQRWGRGLDLQTSEDLPRELFRLRDDLRLTIPGLGTFDDIDAACALPVGEAVETFGNVRPFSAPEITDRYCMELAIHEARRSVGEHSRANPKVGAVVVKGGSVLATAHRGELGEGDHAEFTALEKKLHNEALLGTTVYTTLEPCTTRNHPKVPCARRLFERRVARVLIGMLDPNPSICGKGERFLRDHGVEVDRFPHDLIVRLEELNRDFTRMQATRSGG